MPDLILEMIARADTQADSGGSRRAAFVGDTSFDTRAARAAGLPCVLVSFGFLDCPADELGAAAVIDHYDELVPALERL
jgi:phosphoglycolate phosphatase